MSKEGWKTKQEIAEILGLSNTKLQGIIIHKMFSEIPEEKFAVKENGKWFFNYVAIVKFIRKQNGKE